jgi:hypothetical protein
MLRLSDVRYQGEPKGKELSIDGKSSARDGLLAGMYESFRPESELRGNKSSYKRNVSEPNRRTDDID